MELSNPKNTLFNYNKSGLQWPTAAAFFLGLFSLLPIQATTQSAQRLLTLDDVVGAGLMAEQPAALKPLPDGESFVRLSDDRQRILRCSFIDGSQREVLFDASVSDSIDDVEDYQMSPDGRHILIQTHSRRIYRHSFAATFYIYESSEGSVTPLSSKGRQQVPTWSPDGRRVAFVRDNDIFLTTIGADSERQVTTDGQFNHVLNGIPDWVNEEEFATDRSMVFTDDGRFLVWIRYDETAVREYSMPIFKGLVPEHSEYADYPGGYTYKYPIAGTRNASVSIWSYNVENGECRKLNVPLDADDYIPRIYSIPGSSEVAILTLNRHQNCLKIYSSNPQQSDCRLLITERANHYVKEEAYTGILFTTRHILLPSDRDGYMHLYLYTHEGKFERQVDDAPYETCEIYGYDEKTGDTYYCSHEPFKSGQRPATVGNAAERYVWVARKNGKRQCLTPLAGWNTAQFSSTFKYFVHSRSTLNSPPVYNLYNQKGQRIKTLVDNSSLRDRLSAYKLGSRELLTLTTQDSIKLNGWIVRPSDFDATKRYPVIMYQYGGPGNQQVANRWNVGMAGRGALMEQYLAQQGYVCVCIDNRGTGGRGAAFEKCTYLKLGQLESRDQVETALWLSRQPWVDSERIAIWGWSFGGFNTLMAMSEGRSVFCCGIAIAPPTSWRYYDTVYTERFMRTPQENRQGYEDCPISRARQLSGDLLLCHGIADDNVHFRNTAEYTEALVQADKNFQQLVYTNRNHSIYGGNTRRHLFRQCIQFFNNHMQK